ncbi:39S ribosomal mitochondrial [Brachionus plicatilis]|uniref:39S ribosomal mitochondrial n=1 Tax=Brachionus plicatilis TaxID=10195 RepID=A0A3M7Q6H1_BRAPC|nr:39S ribosomal mitochondrial [Brachionus plicatilis]
MIVNTNRIISSLNTANSISVLQSCCLRTSSAVLSRAVVNKSQRIKLAELLNQESQTKKDVKMDYVNNAEIKFYDPPYLVRDAPFPNYELLNISLKGYDFSILNTYYKYIEKLCSLLKVEVVEAYAMPPRSYKIKTYQPFGTNLDKEYSLQMYHRIVRVKNLKSTLAPLLFETVQLNLPEGVQLNIHEPTFEEDEFRYVPDIELQDMRQKLSEMTKKPGDSKTNKK